MMDQNRRCTRLAKLLLAWFAVHARDLPWRRTGDPYAIWVSEIMLQQTQVKTVIPYWERWMQALPTVGALAKAEPDRVLKLWEGLGYYHRARNLQRAARCIMESHGGKFPEQHEAILELPGIGRYTAGAIGSIAFNQPVPILDGNVMRVLSRVFCLQNDPTRRAAQKVLWELAGKLVNAAGRAGEPVLVPKQHSFLNQSLMELGALVCTPRQPQCGVCPVRSLCLASQFGLVEQLPAVPARAKTIQRRHIILALKHHGRLLIHRRHGGVNEGFWAFPEFVAAAGVAITERLIKQKTGFQVRNLNLLATMSHTITRYRMRLEAFCGTLDRPDSLSGTAGCWVTRAKLDQLPFTAAHRKVLIRMDESGDSDIYSRKQCKTP